MQTIVFLDLDDTIFQTRGKCPPDEATSLTPAAYHRDGSPLSFMSSRQRHLFDWLNSSATVIPVTARSESAFRRVTLPFRHSAILDFGGIIVQPDGTLDEVWDQQIRSSALPLQEELTRIQQAWQRYSDERQLGVNVRVIRDFEMDLYVVAKHPGANVAALKELLAAQESLVSYDLFFIHQNDNNLSVVPQFLGKERAVQYFLSRHVGSEPALTLGLGDSHSDLPFITLCDFAMMPRHSQALRSLSPSGTHPIRHGLEVETKL